MKIVPETTELVFFLGGHDLEMVTIRDLLIATPGVRFHDKRLGWGARASDYRSEIDEALANGMIPVLIELEVDVALPEALVIDHHGLRAGSEAPTSLHQVFELLGLPPSAWTRWHTLVAANDRGYIKGLEAEGAIREEIVEVRRADRQAQGITEAEEAAAEACLASLEERLGGALSLIHLSHDRTATITDRLEAALGGPGFRNLLIISPESLNFYGSGEVIRALVEAFPGGWYGGALPERGFWGIDHGSPEVISFIERQLRALRNVG
jgi:hypothetical protein